MNQRAASAALIISNTMTAKMMNNRWNALYRKMINQKAIGFKAFQEWIKTDGIKEFNLLAGADHDFSYTSPKAKIALIKISFEFQRVLPMSEIRYPLVGLLDRMEP